MKPCKVLFAPRSVNLFLDHFSKSYYRMHSRLLLVYKDQQKGNILSECIILLIGTIASSVDVTITGSYDVTITGSY